MIVSIEAKLLFYAAALEPGPNQGSLAGDKRLRGRECFRVFMHSSALRRVTNAHRSRTAVAP